VRFWDSSALVPLVVAEPSSDRLRGLAGDRRRLVVWWAATVECASALARREREGDLDPAGTAEALVTLDGLADEWSEVPPTGRVRDVARRLVRVHDLRAADALQLAAAYEASAQQPATLELVTLDERLARAATREGFRIVDPAR
jgi:predicted nucleic acid-binding protein